MGALKVTHSVTLLDASHRTLEFNDDGGLSVEFSDMAAGKAVPFNVGRSCGKIAFSGPMDKPTEVRVTIDANCSGGGVVTRAKVTISDCGKTGLKIFP